MSSEAIAYVFKQSPYKGTTRCVHLSIGDVVNDMHKNLFWMSVEELALKSNASERATQLALATMVEDGYLELVEEQRHHGTRTYRFLFKPAASPQQGVQNLRPSGPGVQKPEGCKNTPTGVQKATPRGAGSAPKLKRTQKNSTTASSSSNNTAFAPPTTDDDDLVTATARLAAIRDYDNYQADRRNDPGLKPVRSYNAFLAGCARNWTDQYGPDAHALAEDNPHYTPEQLLAAVDAYGTARKTTAPTPATVGCDNCDAGWIETNNAVTPCPTCRPQLSTGNQGATG